MLKDSRVEGSESLHTCQETFGKHRSMGSFSTVIHPEGFASKALALNGTLFDKRRACGSVYLSVSFGVLPGHNPYDNTSKFQNMSKPMQKDANIANESTTDKSPQLVSPEEAVPSRAAAAKEKGVLEASRETKTDEEDKADKWQEEEAAAAKATKHNAVYIHTTNIFTNTNTLPLIITHLKHVQLVLTSMTKRRRRKRRQ